MTQTTEYRPLLPPLRSRTTALVHCVLRGAVAAGLGLGSLAVLVMLLWISSPYPDSGPGGALHVTAALWLLAHGVELTRHNTLSGSPAPLGVSPMMLMVLPMWLLYRAARDALDPEERRPIATMRGAFFSVFCGYLLVTAAVLMYAERGPMPAEPLSVLIHLPLAVGAAAGIGVWRGCGCPRGPLPRWVRAGVSSGVRTSLRRPWAVAALRSGAAGTSVLVGGGALLVGGSLVWHAAAARTSLMQLTGVWPGRFAVLLLAVALVPNAAVWAASYALGPGFALGTGATVTPLAMAGNPALPYFPLLAALPSEGRGTPLTWSVAAVPVVAGAVTGCFATRVRHDTGGPHALRSTVQTAAVGAVWCAVMTAALAALAGGPLGTGTLASFGPVAWRTGVAALLWMLVTALPVALARYGWTAWRSRPVKVRVKDTAKAAAKAAAKDAAKDAKAAAKTAKAPSARRRRWTWRSSAAPAARDASPAASPQTAAETTRARGAAEPPPEGAPADEKATGQEPDAAAGRDGAAGDGETCDDAAGDDAVREPPGHVHDESPGHDPDGPPGERPEAASATAPAGTVESPAAAGPGPATDSAAGAAASGVPAAGGGTGPADVGTGDADGRAPEGTPAPDPAAAGHTTERAPEERTEGAPARIRPEED
ncbi:cell division protein PerM [Streptomyces sp. NBC_00344]|uniref:cell division protein PerM n=1 Tax=Streptomyces sp. NBC_00344 TaxID=2975720 RepID=UPI002E1E15D8